MTGRFSFIHILFSSGAGTSTVVVIILVKSRKLRTRKVTLLLSTTMKYRRIPVDMVCERTSKRALLRTEIHNSLNARGKRGMTT